MKTITNLSCQECGSFIDTDENEPFEIISTIEGDNAPICVDCYQEHIRYIHEHEEEYEQL